MRIAVTGSAGFIGSHLVPQLKREGYEVIEISRSKGYDLSDWSSVSTIATCEVIIHLASRTFVPDSFSNPKGFYKDNYLLTLHSLELARIWKAEFIYMSSYFYGPPKYLPVDEKHPLHPHNPYAQTKYLSEELCRGYSRDFAISVIAFRLFNVYGPGQKASFLIPEIIEKAKLGGKISLRDPRPKRDYIHVNDVVKAIKAAINYRGTNFEIFNLGTGSSVSVDELVKEIRRHAPVKFEIEYTNEYRTGEVLDSVADTRKIERCLNWKAKISLREGVRSLFKI